MSKNQIPFTVDQVGSFLRPASIKQARIDFTNKKITSEQLRKIENTAIKELVQKQKQVGLHGITDGEFRRSFWHLDFLEHLNGLEGYVPDHGYNQHFHGKAAPSYNVRVVDKISFDQHHPFLADFAYLKSIVEVPDDPSIAKATIPSPTMILRQELLANDGSTKIHEIYPDLTEFYHDLAVTYHDVIAAYAKLGCRYLQFDDTNWAFLADQQKRTELKEKGIDPDQIAAICTTIINEALKDKPANITITTHICRGNHASSWLFSGGYEPIAKNLFATLYDGYFLEYDSERAGDFAPLRYWKNNGSQVVLGLVTSKFSELEDPLKIEARIKEATQYIPLDYLSISPQCGFASTEEGNHLTEEQQWQKITLLQKVAAKIWS
ncbi:5-methyltetrahydropteroyltriglutamate--homocysteine S-methyltransferase [Enterococcus sp. CSURQ0835]|uniref:5-methyltetrahydropteroyltriglutamate-- homocysteine S-methyltransferase n=1 Tax=Enterococcus sp. CSURQ0835 TaxID=2681394 RepID=UPI00135C50B9|nr:5-methyltetrahydropteroyltriglutamate--homocysteine S-methyltransferase [Enterococcus sp. CSURQ0835]